MVRDSGPLRPVPTRCLKIDFFVSLVHWNILCTIIIRAVLIVTINNVLLLIDYITITELSACFCVGLLLLRSPLFLLALRSPLFSDFRSFKISYVQTFVRSKLPVSRLSCVHSCFQTV